MGAGLPLFRSRDLVNWERVGGLLERAPGWAARAVLGAGADALGRARARLFTALPARHQKCAAPLHRCRDRAAPAGPWRDLGRPLACPPSGAIDAFVLRDEHGVPQLLHRRYRDGGGIWALPLRADGLALAPAARARCCSRREPDDGGVVEGPAIVRRDGAFTLLFATGSCCRPPCDYRTAVARSRSLLGPYVRDPEPLLQDGDRLRCNGHGTVVGDGRGRQWLLHHGVLADDPLNVRRTVVLEPLRWGDDGWPRVGDDGRPLDSGATSLGDGQRAAPSPTPSLAGPRLDPGWELPWTAQPTPASATAGSSLAARPRRRAGAAGAGRRPARDGAGAGRRLRARPGGRQRRADGRRDVPAWSGSRAGRRARGRARRRPGPARRSRRQRSARTRARRAQAARLRAPSTSPSRSATAASTSPLRGAGGGRGEWRELDATATSPPDQRAIRIALTCRGPRGTSASFGDLAIEPLG